MAVAALKTKMRAVPAGSDAAVADLERRLEAVKSAAARAHRLEGERVGGRLIEVTAALSGLIPGGGLKPGAAYTVEGSTALAAALLAKPSSDGAWCGIVGMQGFAAEAAVELGADLSRLVFIPRPGRDWVNVVVALIDALTVIVVRPPSMISDGEAARLSARLRQRQAVLIACGGAQPTSVWPRPEARISVSDSKWHGLSTGRGHLTSRQVEVTSVGRGAAIRPRRTSLWLPDAEGNVRVCGVDAEQLAAEFQAVEFRRESA
jgi:hypothetical protein